MSNFWVFCVSVVPSFFETGNGFIQKSLKNLTLILVWFWLRWFSTLTLKNVKLCRWFCLCKMESKINLKTIFLYLWFVQRNLVTCPVLSLFKLSNTNFLFKKFEKEKKSLEEVLNHWTGHGTHRTYKHSYSILCHTVSGVTKTISPVVKNLDQRLGFKSSYKICPNWNVCD